MLRKNYPKQDQTCRDTFKHVNEENYNTAAPMGDFNGWNIEICFAFCRAPPLFWGWCHS